ncbi:hypothetical protein ACXJY6_11215 [Vibrio sp. RC27]
MCSVSWLVDKDGYQIFFNRDEQKTRADALPPQILHIDGVDVVMPIDPVGQGSWISTNEMGLSLCLLNNYQASNPNDVILSRGLLLKSLSSENSIESVREAFSKLALPQFAPFSLLAFDRSVSQDGNPVMAFEWNGVESNVHPTDSPLFSSGVDLHNVIHYRKTAFQSIVGEERTQENLLKFHRHQHAEHSHMSVSMHRGDAKTVSFTHIEVSNDSQQMRYVAGSPSTQLTLQALTNNTTALPNRNSLALTN